MRKLFFIFLSLLIAFSASAQTKKQKKDQKRKKIDAIIRQEEEGVITYKKHTAFGGKLINDGYGVFLELGRAKTVKKGMLYQLELSEYKSPKQEKAINYTGFGTPFIYGKENFFYPVKLGAQQEILFGNKSNKNGVSVTGNFGGGLTIGLLRPYYVQLLSNGNYVKYQSADSTKFLDPGAISAGPKFSSGWNEVKAIPGAYLKTALRFDYGSYNETVSALEIGVSGEYYSQSIPIMAHIKPKQFFFTGYVAIMFGKRK